MTTEAPSRDSPLRARPRLSESRAVSTDKEFDGWFNTFLNSKAATNAKAFPWRIASLLVDSFNRENKKEESKKLAFTLSMENNFFPPSAWSIPEGDKTINRTHSFVGTLSFFKDFDHTEEGQFVYRRYEVLDTLDGWTEILEEGKYGVFNYREREDGTPFGWAKIALQVIPGTIEALTTPNINTTLELESLVKHADFHAGVVKRETDGAYYICIYAKSFTFTALSKLVKNKEFKAKLSSGDRPVIALTNCILQVDRHERGHKWATTDNNSKGMKESKVYFCGWESQLKEQLQAMVYGVGSPR